MKAPEMREMTLEELRIHHDGLIDELVNLRIKLSIKQLDNPKRVTILRKEIARAKTILKEKAEGALPGEKPGEAKED
jgi:large subunit ribosomal protein L29